LIDTEAQSGGVLSKGLGRAGFEVVVTGDGPTGLRAALHSAFDVILLELAVPGLSGGQVVQRLRAEGVDTPVLMISAKAGEADRINGLDQGADGFLGKPLSVPLALAQIRAMLRRRRLDSRQPRTYRVGYVRRKLRTAGAGHLLRTVPGRAYEIAVDVNLHPEGLVSQPPVTLRKGPNSTGAAARVSAADVITAGQASEVGSTTARTSR
jgi:CheY-like chemotaxis protein